MSEVPIPGQLVVSSAERCDRGKVREENQDSLQHARIALGELFVVADGIGGYLGGATASKMVVDGFYEYLSSLPAEYPPDRAIREASARTNAAILAAANSPTSVYQHMGSTVVLAIVNQDATAGTHAWIGHIGDSRAYLARSGQLIRITRDHSAVEALLSRNLISPEEALHHPDASVLTRSLGHLPEVEINIEKVPLQAGDNLLLCSDGLWGYVPEQEIQLVVINPELTVETMAETLRGLAMAAGGHDNIGIELVRLSLPPVAVDFKGPRRHGFLEILAVCLLAVAAFGAVAYFAMQSQWLRAIWPRRSHASTSAPSRSVAVLGPAGAMVANLTETSGWQRSNIPLDKVPECQKLASATRKLTIYYKERKDVEQFIIDHPSLLKSGSEHEIVELNPDVQARCGQFSIIVILPAGSQS
jgi:protein phosphatase